MTRNKGFTVIELTLALAVFSLALLIVVSGFLLVVRQYQQVVASRKVQQNVRFAMDDITRELRRATDMSNVQFIGTAPSQQLCIIKGGGVVSYAIDSATQTLTRYDSSNGSSGCYGGTPTKITDSDVQVWRLLITKDGSTSTVRVRLKLASTGSSLDGNFDCKPGATFCAASSLDTSIEVRGGS